MSNRESCDNTRPPFDSVSMCRHRFDLPEGKVVVIGVKDGVRRERFVDEGIFDEQAMDHLRYAHGWDGRQNVPEQIQRHADMRAIVAFLMD